MPEADVVSVATLLQRVAAFPTAERRHRPAGHAVDGRCRPEWALDRICRLGGRLLGVSALAIFFVVPSFRAAEVIL